MSNSQKKSKAVITPAKYALIALSFAIIILFRFISPADPITPVGMALLGDLIGFMILWTFVDSVWTTFLIVPVVAIDIWGVYDATQSSPVYEAGMQAFGQWIPVFILGCLFLTYSLESHGTFRRITYWFVTRKTARKSPWHFTMMFIIAIALLSMFVDCIPMQLFSLSIAYEFFELFGYKKEDGAAYPKMIVSLICIVVLMGYFMTPICHPLTILFMGLHDGIVGSATNLGQYVLIAIPVGVVVIALLLLYFRFIAKIDVSRLSSFDFSALEQHKPEPMGRAEKLTVTIFGIVAFCWIAPGIIDLIAPGNAFSAFMNTATVIAPVFLAIVALCIIQVDGKPLMELKDAFTKVPWAMYIMMSGIICIANAIAESETGISDFIVLNAGPLLGNLSPFWLVVVVAIVTCLLSNCFDDVPVGIMLTYAVVPIAVSAGLPTIPIGIAITFGALSAFMLPAGSIQAAITYQSPWTNRIDALKNGVIGVVMCVIASLLLYPLSSLIF